MITQDREYRMFQCRASDEEGSAVIEGYAAVFESPTVLSEIDGIKYSEVIRRGAFDDTEMRDVVLNYNHDGKPVARTKNNTLKLTVDDVGVKVWADIGGTEEGRRLYEEIKGGYLDKMSFAFTIDEQEYDRKTRTSNVTKIKRLYDVAVVDLPAYDDTYVKARSRFLAEAEKERAEALRARKGKLKTKILLEV